MQKNFSRVSFLYFVFPDVHIKGLKNCHNDKDDSVPIKAATITHLQAEPPP